MIIAYTDGASSGNPGPGGYGVVLISPKHNLRKEISEGFRLTTNNRMELLAVIKALEALKVGKQEITIHSDSSYVVNAVTKGWLWGWIKKDFKGKKNKDLWIRYANVAQYHTVHLKWVKGHAGIPENERCDQLATEAAKQSNLKIDEGYEQS
ncbi:ribonuclease HI [Sediminitomix flava]|uniref:ribonuclease H n=1 Tax=Sediminitomix flava TaxID=379075 RepID=A0A315Z6R0_SEDFL|nr:ribonuclease HI [Sediminitomix flava]PWJ39392.1 RNase HI [Sediminitomix flava]